MHLDEALTHAVEGARIRGDHMAPGCYVEHTFSRGYLRCWPVDRVEDERNRTQCDFRPDATDKAAEWSIVERPRIDSWGQPLDKPRTTAEKVEAATGLDLAAFDPKLRKSKSERIPNHENNTLEGWSRIINGAPPKRDSWGRPID